MKTVENFDERFVHSGTVKNTGREIPRSKSLWFGILISTIGGRRACTCIMCARALACGQQPVWRSGHWVDVATCVLHARERSWQADSGTAMRPLSYFTNARQLRVIPTVDHRARAFFSRDIQTMSSGCAVDRRRSTACTTAAAGCLRPLLLNGRFRHFLQPFNGAQLPARGRQAVVVPLLWVSSPLQ